MPDKRTATFDLKLNILYEFLNKRTSNEVVILIFVNNRKIYYSLQAICEILNNEDKIRLSQ